MSRYSFKVGEIVEIDGERFEIVNLVGRKVQARAVESGELRDWLLTELQHLYAKGQLKFTDLLTHATASDPALPPGAIGRTLQDFPEEVREKAIRKWKYLKAICPEGRIAMSRTSLEASLKDLAPQIENRQTDRPPSSRTFYRWYRNWIKAHMDVRALIDRFDLRGRKPSESEPKQLVGIITEGIETFYLTDQRQSKQDLLDWIHHETSLVNRTLPPEEALPEVSMRTVNKFLAQYDRYHTLKARYGERYARQSVRTFGLSSLVSRLLQRVEIDHTPLDIQVVDDRTQMILGRPWITIMIDVYSRMVIGLFITFRKPSAESVLRCLKNAIAPKTYVKERFPDIEGEWPCFGLIEELWCDNGLEFHGKDIEAGAQELGIHVMYCPSRQPHFKGTIERFNRTLNEGLLHRLPGTTFARYDQRLEYKTDEKTVLPMSVLEEIIHRWVIDVYACDFHRALQTAPLEKWYEGIAKAPPKLPPDINALNVYLGQVDRRTLNRNGIQANGLHYNSDALQDMRHRYGDIQVTVRSNPDDLEHIHVLDEQRKFYVMAQCTMPEYARGLTVEQHALICRKAKEDYASLPYRQRVLAAKADIQKQVATLLAQFKKPGTPAAKTNAKLDREARELLKAHPGAISAAPVVSQPPQPSFDSFLDDEWFDDIPDLVVENRDAKQTPLKF